MPEEGSGIAHNREGGNECTTGVVEEDVGVGPFGEGGEGGAAIAARAAASADVRAAVAVRRGEAPPLLRRRSRCLDATAMVRVVRVDLSAEMVQAGTVAQEAPSLLEAFFSLLLLRPVHLLPPTDP